MINENSQQYKFKKDRYAKNRGGNSRFFNIICCACHAHIALYQKDGPGALLRMYVDRIFAPSALVELQGKAPDKKELPNLLCPSCGVLIATPMVYELENRLAFRMVPGSFGKKKSDGTYPPANL